MPRTLPSVRVLVGIGLAAGFFSALFGVGGGVIVVPLLILLAGFESRAATATSLAVIGFTAVFGVVAFASLGEIHWGYAALVGLPALLGTLAGTALQQRVTSRFLTFVFALLLVGISIQLFLE